MGNTPLYLANIIWKLEAGDKLKKGELFDINGFTVKVTVIKSRANRAGQVGEFVYDQVRGYDNYLSDLLYFKDNKMLSGAGIGLYFAEEGDVPTKFKLGNFKEKLKENKEFRVFFKKFVRSNFSEFINKDEDIFEDIENTLGSHSDEEKPVKTVKKKKKRV